jgi:predicted transcriptional regulator
MDTSTTNNQLTRVLTPIRVDDAIVELLTVSAQAVGESKSKFIRQALIDRFKRLSRTKPEVAAAMKENLAA